MKTKHSLHHPCGWILLAIAAALAAAPVVRADYVSTVLSDHPIAFYALYLTNSTEPDLSGNGNDGSYVNIYPGYNNVPGPSAYITNGVSFDGLTTYVDLSTGTNTGILNFGGPITMEAWVQSATSGYIMGKGYDANQNADEVEMRVSGGVLHGGTYNGTTGDAGVSGGNVGTNWVHAVVSNDGTNWNLYVNGQLLATSPDTVGAINFVDPWAIGDGTVSAASRIITGNLSEVALYTNALTPTQVLTHYFVGSFGTTNVAPIIVKQPASQLAAPGATVSFSFQAQSLLPITNQWYKNGLPLLNQTNATLVLSNVQTNQAGNYSVLVGNSAGATNSSAANLSVETEGVYGFSAMALTTASYNKDMIIEKQALVAATTATLDGGTANNGTTWFERGYYTADNTIGLPTAGSTFTSASQADHSYTMAPSYTTNDAVLLNSTVASATLTLTTPAAYSGLSFLASSGNGGVTINYIVHHADSTIETNSFTAPDWFGSGTLAVGVGGRVDASTRGFQTWGAGSLPYIFSADIALTNTTSPVTSVDLSYSAGGNACVLAVSGSTGTAYNPITVTGYNQDMIVEASAQQFVGGSYTTASMDNGTANTGFSWYELGYSTTPSFAPGTGVPAAGSAITSQAQADHHFKMAASYTANDVAYVDASTSDTITFGTPSTVWALSLLTAAGHGPINVNYTVHHADSTTESGTFASPDWFGSGTIAWAVNGRVDVGNGGMQTWGSGGPRICSVDIGVTNISSPVTSIDLSFGTGNYSGGVAAVFAVSGAFTSQGDAFTSLVENGNGSTTLNFAGIPGYHYLLQFAPSLTPPVLWQNVSTNTAAANGLWQFTDSGATNHTTGFYRTLYLP